jgi:hypothetical protein
LVAEHRLAIPNFIDPSKINFDDQAKVKQANTVTCQYQRRIRIWHFEDIDTGEGKRENGKTHFFHVESERKKDFMY